MIDKDYLAPSDAKMDLLRVIERAQTYLPNRRADLRVGGQGDRLELGGGAVKTLIFDCDGVLADTERYGHLPAFNGASLPAARRSRPGVPRVRSRVRRRAPAGRGARS